MTRTPETWQRVTRRQQCPVCDKSDWCLFAGDPRNPAAAICARVESKKRCGEAGWLHVLRDDGPTWPPWRRTIRRAVKMMAEVKPNGIDFGRLAGECRAAMKPQALGRLAKSLGLAVGSLTRLGIGWSDKHRAWTFPMTDAGGNVRGIRLRLPDGRKLAVRGGHEGLFIPADLDAGGQLLITEGPTDTAALLDLDFDAIGRPSCTGGGKLLVDYVQKRQAAPHSNPLPEGEGNQVVIMADSDGPGRRGAERLAAVLIAYCPLVRVIGPPDGVNDAREWKRQGATRQDIQAIIDAAPVRRLSVHVRRKVGRKHGRR